MSDKLKFKDDVIIQKLDEDTILLDLKTEEYFSLNDIGSEIVELFQKDLTKEEVITKLLKVYDSSKEQLDNDITQLIEKLNEKNLILKKE